MYKNRNKGNYNYVIPLGNYTVGAKGSCINLMEILNVPEAIARLLAIRGISSFEDAKQFLDHP